MSWIKRNLYFLVFSGVALALMALAGWYLYHNWDRNEQIRQQLTADYTELDRLNKQRPHPGSGAINNITAAADQQAALLAFKDKARAHFVPISPIPDLPKITAESFSTNLTHTINQLQQEASAANVSLPDTNYAFSFAAQNSRVVFAPAGLEPLSVQLGEVKAICEILFQAKVNNLDAIRRERVSSEDQAGNATDYLSEKSKTNDLAVITPYEVTFRCFSQELGEVLAGFATATPSFIIKTINVDPAPAAAASQETAPALDMAALQAQSAAMAAAQERQNRMNAQQAFNSRYGMGGARPRPPPSVLPATPAPAAQKSGLNTVLDEKQLKVVMVIDLVKLLSDKPAAGKPAAPRPAASKPVAAK